MILVLVTLVGTYMVSHGIIITVQTYYALCTYLFNPYSLPMFGFDIRRLISV